MIILNVYHYITYIVILYILGRYCIKTIHVIIVMLYKKDKRISFELFLKSAKERHKIVIGNVKNEIKLYFE